LLYKEENLNNINIGKLIAQDLRKAPDLIIVIGISFKVLNTKRLTKELYYTIKASRSIIV